MIASQAIRLASPSPTRARRRARGAVRAARGARRPANRAPARHGAAHRAVRPSSWDLRLFALALAAILFAFAVALLYVSEATALSVAGYDAQKLQATRDELRRQSSLLDVQAARLDSPARIAGAAGRLGMIRASYVPVVPADPLTAKR